MKRPRPLYYVLDTVLNYVVGEGTYSVNKVMQAAKRESLARRRTLTVVVTIGQALPVYDGDFAVFVGVK